MTTGRERWLHLYEFRVEADVGAGAWELLSGEERGRAHSIADPRRRMRFVARRAALHRILAQYAARPRVSFSSSDSGDLAAVAIAPRPVGVDIEIETPRRPQERIAERMFAADERDVLDTVDGAARRHLFHRCWVAKEAYAKGRGGGLAMPFAEFSVAAALRSRQGSGPVGDGWTVALTTRGDVHLAVAAPGDDWQVEGRPVPAPAAEMCVG